jgi:hypothetical protein
MRLDPERLLGPIVALILLALILQQTVGALRSSGVWSRRPTAARAASPYARLDRLLAGADSQDGAAVSRDPFAYERPPAPEPSRRPSPRPHPAPPPPARPVLTAIIWSETSPSATIRWNGRDYPVQPNTLFDEFRVTSITRNQVTLERGAETLVLQLPKKGD